MVEGQSLGGKSEGEVELQLSLWPVGLDARVPMGDLVPVRKEEGSIGSTGTEAVSPLPAIIQNWTERFWYLRTGVTRMTHNPGNYT